MKLIPIRQVMVVLLVVSFGTGVYVSRSVALHQSRTQQLTQLVHVWPTDQLTLVNQSGIDQLTVQGEKQLVTASGLFSPVLTQNGVIAIARSLNYSVLEQFDVQGNLLKTLLDGDHQNFDKMIWVGDPAIRPDQQQLVFVSDKDRLRTGVADNAVYSLDLATSAMTLLAKPTYLTGGFANPMYVPESSSSANAATGTTAFQLLVTNYQYDQTTFLPYSLLQLLDVNTRLTENVTTPAQNAFQPSFSADGRQLLFLSRDGESAQVKLILADVTRSVAAPSLQLTNLRTLATGQFAFPRFSFTQNQIYYLSATQNTEFQLYTATITGQSLTNQQQITTREPLPAGSSYVVSQMKGS